jgi:hypothetical protein
MKYELYAVEIEVSSNPLTYKLECRYSEDGPGSPLTWPTREAAEKYVDGLRKDPGGQEYDPDSDIFKVVPLTGETDSENEDPEFARQWDTGCF